MGVMSVHMPMAYTCNCFWAWWEAVLKQDARGMIPCTSSHTCNHIQQVSNRFMLQQSKQLSFRHVACCIGHRIIPCVFCFVFPSINSLHCTSHFSVHRKAQWRLFFYYLSRLGSICNIMRVQSFLFFWTALSACNFVSSIVPKEIDGAVIVCTVDMETHSLTLCCCTMFWRMCPTPEAKVRNRTWRCFQWGVH